jgi:RimJ/RimL family protein N-acetyltransferase
MEDNNARCLRVPVKKGFVAGKWPPAPWSGSVIIETSRMRLRNWRAADREAFAAMASDPEVMHDLGGPLDRTASDAKLDRYVSAYNQHGFCRWLIEDGDGRFLGYAGVMPVGGGHPLGSHFDIGWRLVHRAWGHGYATEAARAALQDAFGRAGLTEVLSYTAPDNARSQRVMQRLGLLRDPSRDFAVHHGTAGQWQSMVWAVRRDWAERHPCGGVRRHP